MRVSIDTFTFTQQSSVRDSCVCRVPVHECACEFVDVIMVICTISWLDHSWFVEPLLQNTTTYSPLSLSLSLFSFRCCLLCLQYCQAKNKIIYGSHKFTIHIFFLRPYYLKMDFSTFVRILSWSPSVSLERATYARQNRKKTWKIYTIVCLINLRFCHMHRTWNKNK